MTDEQLMDSFSAGCDESFSLLSKKWSPKLLTFISKKVYRKELAEEILQETFFSIYKGKNSWSSNDHKFSSWIFTIATNVIISANRTKKSKMEILNVDDQQREISFFNDPTNKLSVEKALSHLPPHFAEAFRLTYIEGMDHNEACKIANVTPDNMRARASRSRSMLREIIG